MTKLTSLMLLAVLASASHADDTEIYGAAEIDLENRVNSNVLFIMDTSGSMRGAVSVAKTPYNANTVYPGNHYRDRFYYSLNHGKNKGIPHSALSSADSSGCETTATALIDLTAIPNVSNTGKILGNYQQFRSSSWQRLAVGNTGNVRCDVGSAKAYWLYNGNYMNWRRDSSNFTSSTRMQVTVDVLNELTHSLSNINLGLMRFDGNADGGLIDVAIDDVANTGALIRNKLDSYTPNGYTPLSETLYEAARYYRGEDWQYGNNSIPNTSVSASRNGSTYISPIDATCQKNNIILLTDGEPLGDTHAQSYIQNWVSPLALPPELNKSCSGNGGCLDELAYFLNETDQSTSQVGGQNITTYTIGGFDLVEGVTLLKRTAKWGGGQYYEANDTAGLTSALESIFLSILSTDSTFTAPAVSVNAFNASEHRDDLFYALFRPDDSAKWAGNLKRYRLDEDGKVYDVNDTPAISQTTGFFKDGAKDFWNQSAINDGKNVTQGGMANLLDPGKRNIYSHDSSDILLSFTNSANATSLDMVGASAAEVEQLLKWSRGYDVGDADGDGSETDGRYSIGDPLHSEPVVVTYGGSEASPDSTIFFGTNEGFIHALDADTGVEQFAFIPKALHRTQKIYYANITAAGDRPYGMDGPITTWMKDVNNNNVVFNGATLEPDEHVYLYAGMRRGGRNYYALDVTHRSNPSMLFKIEGGQGDFVKLGQTWSRMTIAKVKFPGGSSDDGTRIVAFFSGGYDTNQDGNDLAEGDGHGNAIYMVDATTGERLWWASNTGSAADLEISHMDNSIPASISAVDISGNGLVDYLFAADTGGRVFRIDLDPSPSNAGDFAQGGMIASLAGSDVASNRRFYNKPNVALVKDKLYGDYLTISIGSGHRAHPLFTTAVENRFYLIKDFYPYAAPSSYGVKTEAAIDDITLATGDNADPLKLYNATSLMNEGKAGLTSSLQVLMNNGGGWYITFSNTGEKVLSPSTTFSGAVIFTSFTPSGGASSDCGPDTGASRVYAIDQKWAMPVIDQDGDGDTDTDDASKVLAHSGIAPRPVVIYRKGGGKTIAIGTETIDDSRFEEKAASDDCADNDSCAAQAKKCETNNCYVNPLYWRQDGLDIITPQENPHE